MTNKDLIISYLILINVGEHLVKGHSVIDADEQTQPRPRKTAFKVLQRT